MNKNFKINSLIWDFLKEYKYFIFIYLVFMMAFPLELIAQPHYYGKIINNISKNPVSKIFSENSGLLFTIIVIWFTFQILYGSMDIKDLIQPTIDLCIEGIPVTPDLYGAIHNTETLTNDAESSKVYLDESVKVGGKIKLLENDEVLESMGKN